jgi:predicted nucleic acid-binding protein
MKVLLDTNVVVDLLLLREPWATEAKEIWQAAIDGRLECYISASSVTDIYYICRKICGKDGAYQAVRDCLDSLIIIPIDESQLEQAFAATTTDMENALQMVCAANNQLDAIVTRDQTGFMNSPIPVLAPSELVTRLTSSS